MDSPLIVPTAPRLTDTKDSEEVRKSLLDFAAKVNETIISERRAFTEQLGNTDDPYFIMYDDADAHTFPLPENAPLKTTYSFMRTVASANSITVTTSGGDTVEGATSFITHGATVSTTLNNQIVKITKTGATTWSFAEGVVSSYVSGRGWYIMFGDGTMMQNARLAYAQSIGFLTWTFPVPFAVNDWVMTIGSENGAGPSDIYTFYYAHNIDAVNVYLRGAGWTNQMNIVNLEVWGRWKA